MREGRNIRRQGKDCRYPFIARRVVGAPGMI